ncbi:ArsR/SmtB family transcription factor [Paenibacillus sp. FSL W7-1287]|uniref:ArsR/SmtB family transcription factor n=1 Tax=Paenibacillus sp. FSL W7-1287 TaxID=2954538 RepID=UPI0030FB6C7F
MAAASAKHDVFQAIADPTRRRMLHLLADQELPITQIAASFPISRTAVNKHLHVLAEAGLLSKRRAGRETRFKLQAEPLTELQQWLAFFEQYWDEHLLALKEYVESE